MGLGPSVWAREVEDYIAPHKKKSSESREQPQPRWRSLFCRLQALPQAVEGQGSKSDRSKDQREGAKPASLDTRESTLNSCPMG